MKVTNPDPHQVWVPQLGVNVAAGASIDVDDAVGTCLVAAGWKKSPAKSAKTEEG